ncbi:MAG: DNA repair protein RecO [Pseudomonadota bacterium]
MEWRAEGILLWVRRHGETSAIIEVLTPEHGRHAGLVQGGATQAKAQMLQPGAQLSLEWSARLAEHLGTYKIDLVRSRAATIMTSRDSLAALNVVSALLVKFLPEREPSPELYDATLQIVDCLGEANPFWPVLYAKWELSLLQAVGFGLDLNSCASTGTRDDLVYVSPRSGRAVCRAAGAPFAARMLPLPQFLIDRGVPSMPDVREALRLTGYFLENWVCPAFEVKSIPEARKRLIRLSERMKLPLPRVGPVYSDDELEWLAKYDAAPELDDPVNIPDFATDGPAGLANSREDR